MIENIGQKIKRIRKEMNLTQDNVHHNQSQISQIESGRINYPDQATLETIANNLSLSLDELIENTDWEKPESPIINKELGFSPVIVDVEIDDKGNISWTHKTYPMYNGKGEKNEFCPKSGFELITHCERCDRQVEDAIQEYCYGCGYSLFGKMEVDSHIRQMLSDHRVFTDMDICEDAIQALEIQRGTINNQTNDISKWHLNQRDLQYLESELKILKKTLKELKGETKEKELKNLNVEIKKIEEAIKEVEKDTGVNYEAAIYWKFNWQVVDSAVKKLRGIVNSLELPPPPTIEEIKLNLYAQLAGLTSQYMNKYLDPFGLMASINDPTKSESDENKTNETKKIEQLMELMREVDKTTDPIKIMEIIKDIANNKDQKISNDSHRKKSESAEKSDSSSKVEEKSNNDKKGVS